MTKQDLFQEWEGRSFRDRLYWQFRGHLCEQLYWRLYDQLFAQLRWQLSEQLSEQLYWQLRTQLEGGSSRDES